MNVLLPIVPIEKKTQRSQRLWLHGKECEVAPQSGRRDIHRTLEIEGTSFVEIVAHEIQYPSDGVALRGSNVATSDVTGWLNRDEAQNVSQRCHSDRRQHCVDRRKSWVAGDDEVAVEIRAEVRPMRDVKCQVDKSLRGKVARVDCVQFCCLCHSVCGVSSLHTIRDYDRCTTAERSESRKKFLIVLYPAEQNYVTETLPAAHPARDFPRLAASRSLPSKNVCKQHPRCPKRDKPSFPIRHIASPAGGNLPAQKPLCNRIRRSFS